MELLMMWLLKCPFWPCHAWVGGGVGLAIGLIAGIPIGKKLAGRPK
jgi:hypothetical protein